MNQPDDNPYTVHSENQLFAVRGESGKIVVTSGDQSNADGYAVLLNEAYRKGYKDGYRAGKQSGQ